MIAKKLIPPAPVGNVDAHNLLLTTLVNELDSMVYLCRCDRHWTIEFVSEGCHALTGYAPQDLLHNKRRSFADLMHSDDRDRVLGEIQAALNEGRSFSVEYRMLHVDGSERWVWERGQGLEASVDQIPLVRGFVQDITDRHNREKALAEAEQRYRSIFEHATEGIFQSTQDGHYLEVNPALAAITVMTRQGKWCGNYRILPVSCMWFPSAVMNSPDECGKRAGWSISNLKFIAAMAP